MRIPNIWCRQTNDRKAPVVVWVSKQAPRFTPATDQVISRRDTLNVSSGAYEGLCKWRKVIEKYENRAANGHGKVWSEILAPRLC